MVHTAYAIWKNQELDNVLSRNCALSAIVYIQKRINCARFCKVEKVGSLIQSLLLHLQHERHTNVREATFACNRTLQAARSEYSLSNAQEATLKTALGKFA